MSGVTPAAEDYLAREARARMEIDAMLALAGWAVQDNDKVNLAPKGVAVREFDLGSHGRADYLLFVDRKPVGVLEACSLGSTGAFSSIVWRRL